MQSEEQIVAVVALEGALALLIEVLQLKGSRYGLLDELRQNGTVILLA